MSEIPVKIAAQVVAAGILGNKARITLVLVPIFAKKDEVLRTDVRRYDLANWPKEVERFLKDSKEDGVEVEKFRLDVVPLGQFQSWRTKDIFDKPVAIEKTDLTRVAPSKDVEKRNLYWQEVMGPEGFAALAKALDPQYQSKLRDPLDHAFRPPAGSQQDLPEDEKTPDIHGTARGKLANTLSLERARHTANSLAGAPEQRTRPVAVAGDSLTAKVHDLVTRRLGPLPRDVTLTNSELMSLVQEDDALTALKPSEKRADKLAKARRDYQKKETSARKAICALVDAHSELPRPTPLDIATHFAAPVPSKAMLPGSGLDEATAAYRLGSRTPAFNDPDVPLPADPVDVEFARRRLHALQSNPSLGRLFNFVVDFECDKGVLDKVTAGAYKYEETVLDRGPDTPDPLPMPLTQEARFLLIRFVKDHGPRLWSSAKLRLPLSGEKKKQAAGHFLPCTREEIDVRAMAQEKCDECSDKDSEVCKTCKACNALATDVRALAVASQIDGIIDLGQEWKQVPRYEIVTLDPITNTAAEDQKAKKEKEDSLAVENSPSLPPQVREALQQESKPTHRGGGLALVDRWRQLHGIERHLDSKIQQKQYDAGTAPKALVDILLDASDLTAGYKLDVGVRREGDAIKRSRWHTLMHRVVQYAPTPKADTSVPSPDLDGYITKLYGDADHRRDADDAQLQAPAALRDWGFWPPLRASVADEPRNWVTAFMEEVIGAWRGDPLGLACGDESQNLDTRDLRINITYNLPTQDDFTPPRLRYGWRYHFGLRAFFAGGVSLPLNRALGHYEKSYNGELVKPAAEQTGYGFSRDERIDAPVITVPEWLFGKVTPQTTYAKVDLKGRFAAPQAARMIVRSVTDESNRRIADVPDQLSEQNKTPGVGLDRRVLLAPTVSLDFAAMHDAFRKTSSGNIQAAIKLLEPRVLREREKKDDGDDYEINPVPGEEVREEFVPVSPVERGDRKQPPLPVWGKVRVAWRLSKIASRPRGGLRGVDYRAAWGGFPVYRAKSSTGLTKPVLKKPVLRPAPVTDEGEILHRVKGNGETVHGRKLLWSAVGTFPDEEGQGDRSGASVFRPLSNNPDIGVERHPYYPDPAAETLVVAVTVRGRKPIEQPKALAVSLYKKINQKVPAPEDYPDALPVVLDVVRGQSTDVTVKPKINYSQTPHTPPSGQTIAVAHVTVTLAPGEEARILCWCVPSETFLEYMWAGTPPIQILAFAHGLAKDKSQNVDIKQLGTASVDGYVIAGLQALTSIDIAQRNAVKGPPDNGERKSSFAGLPLPTAKVTRELAKEIRARMLNGPVPEIAAVTEIEAVHAVDLPRQEPAVATARPWALLRATPHDIDTILAEDCQPASQPLCSPANWTLQNQRPDAVDVLLEGSLTVHGPSTEAVEIRARATAAARGRFDDVERGRSRDDRARGLWPRPDAQNFMPPVKLFGFEPAEDGTVRFEPDSVTLLRIEGFPPGFNESAAGVTRLDLLDVQRQARALENKKKRAVEDPPLRALRPMAFPDTRARWIELYAVAISRHAAALRTRYNELPEVLTAPRTVNAGATAKELKEKEVQLAIMNRRWLPATVRPARVVSLSPIPSFQWNDNVPRQAGIKLDEVCVQRSVRIRVRAKRPWFSAGEGERIGIVVWPPNLFAADVGNLPQDVVKPPPFDRAEVNLRKLPNDGTAIAELQDADLGPGGGWVTRWGADPIRANGGVQGWLLSKANFPGVTEGIDFGKAPQEHPKDAVLVNSVLMPIPADADAAELKVAQPPGGFMSVSLITYTPRFDPDQETWYVDVDLNPCGAVYPFVRLGLVRFQPNAPRALQVSEPIVEWAQIMPERTLKATAKFVRPEKKEVQITAEVEGIAPTTGYNGGHPAQSPAQAPRVYFSLLRRRIEQGDELAGSEVVYREDVPEPDCGSTCRKWTASFNISSAEYKRYKWSIFVEEVDRLRPATYPDEPRYETISDTNFVDIGPRFVARLPLDDLEAR
ncbi:hypothetical protein ABIF74_011768 [Bradyrhizobium japonicum]